MKRSMSLLVQLLVLLLLAVPEVLAQDAQPAATISIVNGWARATPGGATIGAAYLTIQAAPGTRDIFLQASSPAAKRVELHHHSVDNGIMRMRRVTDLAIEPGRTIKFKPGGYHLMLFGLKQGLKTGTTIKLALTFQTAGRIEITAKVEKIGSMGPKSPGNPAASGSQ